MGTTNILHGYVHHVHTIYTATVASQVIIIIKIERLLYQRYIVYLCTVYLRRNFYFHVCYSHITVVYPVVKYVNFKKQ